MSTYFSHEPNGDAEFHDTPEAAKAEAEDALTRAQFQLDDWTPNPADQDADICWGLVLGRVSVTEEPATPEDKERLSHMGEVDVIRSMSLDDSDALRLWKAAPDLLTALEEGRRAIGEHHAPNDCYATGPMTGDAYRDLVECPACRFLEVYDAAIAKAKPAEATA